MRSNMLVIMLAASLAASCASIRGAGEDAKGALIDCSQQAVATTAVHLVPVLMEIFKNPSERWKDMVEALTREFGTQVIACAVQKASIALSAQVPAQGPADGEAGQMDRSIVTGMQRARMYPIEKGWRYKGDGQ